MVQRQIEEIEQTRLVQRMVIDAIHKQRCRKIGDVVKTLQKYDRTVTFEEVRDAIYQLKKEEEIEVFESNTEVSFLNYIKNISESFPFWLTVLISSIMLITIYLLPQTLTSFRIVVGGILVFLIPGYASIQLLFPAKDMEITQQVVLSVGLSLAIVPLIGLLLNYSPWGLRLEPVMVSLSTFGVGLSLAGAYRRFLLRLSQSLHH